MIDDDDQLSTYDLTAWEAPPPPAGLVDAVIARARVPVATAAIDATERPGRRWWWIAGGVGAAVAAVVLVIGVWGTRRVPADGRGIVVAERAEALAIGPTRAALDPGAEVKWQRTRRKITATQPRGSATWTVAKDDTLVIDAGAMGASVEATGASLRVEVEMNRSDWRAIGVSGATAVAVAAVTVIVYEGHVRVSSGGQTVNVTPGATYQVRPPADDALAVGGGPADPRIAELEAEVARLRAQLADEPDNDLDDDLAPEDRTATVGLPPALDRAMISSVMTALKAPLLACDRGGFTGTLKVRLKVSPAGTVTNVDISSTAAGTFPDVFARCARAVFDPATFPATKAGGSFSYPYLVAAPGACDADALRQRGDDALQTGDDAAALAAFEAALRCAPAGDLAQRAYMAACRAKQATKARAYFARLPASKQEALAQICIRYGIDARPTTKKPAKPAKPAPAKPAPAKPDCDADALRQRGDDHMQTGMDAAALAAFEAAIRCKASGDLYQRAFIAACRAKYAAKARLYYPRLPPSRQTSLAQICIRSGIDPR